MGADLALKIVVTVLGLLAAGSLALSAYLFTQVNEATVSVENQTGNNTKLSCSITRLVAFVPAVQFEGESQQNFIGWINARHDMLEDVRESQQCSSGTQAILAYRARLDEKLLAEIGD